MVKQHAGLTHEEMIKQFCEVTGTTNEIATNFIKESKNDVENALELFFTRQTGEDLENNEPKGNTKKQKNPWKEMGWGREQDKLLMECAFHSDRLTPFLEEVFQQKVKSLGKDQTTMKMEEWLESRWSSFKDLVADFKAGIMMREIFQYFSDRDSVLPQSKKCYWEFTDLKEYRAWFDVFTDQKAINSATAMSMLEVKNEAPPTPTAPSTSRSALEVIEIDGDDSLSKTKQKMPYNNSYEGLRDEHTELQKQFNDVKASLVDQLAAYESELQKRQELEAKYNQTTISLEENKKIAEEAQHSLEKAKRRMEEMDKRLRAFMDQNQGLDDKISDLNKYLEDKYKVELQLKAEKEQLTRALEEKDKLIKTLKEHVEKLKETEAKMRPELQELINLKRKYPFTGNTLPASKRVKIESKYNDGQVADDKLLVDALLNYSTVLCNEKQYQKALQCVNKILEVDTSVVYFMKIAKIFYAQGNLDAAVSYCIQCMKTLGRPDHPQIYRTLGKILMKAKKYDKAIEIFNKALTMEPNNEYFRQQISKCKDPFNINL